MAPWRLGVHGRGVRRGAEFETRPMRNQAFLESIVDRRWAPIVQDRPGGLPPGPRLELGRAWSEPSIDAKAPRRKDAKERKGEPKWIGQVLVEICHPKPRQNPKPEWPSAAWSVSGPVLLKPHPSTSSGLVSTTLRDLAAPGPVHRPPSTVHRPPSTAHRPPPTVHRPPSSVFSPSLRPLPFSAGGRSHFISPVGF